MLGRTDAIMNEVIEPMAFVLAYPTVILHVPDITSKFNFGAICVTDI